MSEQRYYITEAMAEALRDVIARVRGMKISGPGVDFTNTNAGIACVFDLQTMARVAVTQSTFRITASSQVGSTKKWTYTGTKVEKTSAGYGGWTDVTGPVTATLYNTLEDQNGASGTYGNGILQSNLTGSFAMKPIPTGTRVFAQQITLTTGDTEWWIVNYANGVDGAC